jgi:photosystem II stability/assembly factor-like uncharacterized protein
MKNLVIRLVTIAALAVGLTTMAAAQLPPWEFINGPEMEGYTQSAMNRDGVLFVTSGRLGYMNNDLPYGHAQVLYQVSQKPRALLRIAVDVNGQPWMITEDSLYRPRFQQYMWVFDAEVRPQPAAPVFFTITDAGLFFIADPSGGVLRSTDMGRTWTSAGPSGGARITDAVALPDGRILLQDSDAVHESTDGGSSWQLLPLPAGMDAIEQMYGDDAGIVLSGRRAGEVFLAHTTDAGAGWTDITPALGAGSGIRHSSGELLLLVETAFYPYLLYKASVSAAWSLGGDRPLGTSRIHYAKDGPIASVQPNHVHATEGIGEDWKNVHGGASVTQRAAMLQIDEDTYVCYHWDDGFYRSTDGGKHWEETLDYETRLAWELQQSADGQHLYCMFDQGFFWSDDDGISWNHRVLPNRLFESVVTEAGGAWFLIDRNGDRVIRSTDLGQSWKEVHPETTQYSSATLCAVGNRLYLYGEMTLSYSDDLGDTWQPVSGFTVPNASTNLFLFEEDLLFAGDAIGKQTLRSTDLGRSWTAVASLSGVAMFDMVRLPNSSTITGMSFSTSKRLYRSTNSGKTWNVIADDVADAASNIRYTREGHLMIGTSGAYGGHFLWKNAAVLGTNDLPLPVESAGLEIATIWPQPMSGSGSIELRSRSARTIHCAVHDLLGRRVAGVYEGDIPAGSSTYAMTTAQLAPGVYHLRVQWNGGSTARLLVIR